MTDPGRGIPTRVGLHLPASTQGFERLAALAAIAEGSGFDSIWVTDSLTDARADSLAPSPGHGLASPSGDGLTSPPGDRLASPSGHGLASPSGDGSAFEAYTLLGALATRTKTASLGAMVTPVTARNPAMLAKIVTGVDVLSEGRAVLGIGTGPPFDPPSAPERLDRLAEGLQICRAMFTEEAPSFEGRYYRIEDAHNRPRPVCPAGIPILIGGGDEEGVLGLVARYADAVTVAVDVETVRDTLAALDRHCDEVGRDPATIARIGLGTLAIAPTDVEAAEIVDRVAERAGWDPGCQARVVVGSPDAVAAQVDLLLDVGVDGVVFTMADAGDVDSVELAGRTLRSLFA
jgi:alkanesulfonate monooxygenase SsuD/methylene tetrahydromethanopterin reductase-like flavin-dependent oxidoreductase (luciferase family)